MKKLLLAVSILSIFLVGFILLAEPAEAIHASCSQSSILPGPALPLASLDSSDCRSHSRGGNYYADYYKFTAIAGERISIIMDSPNSFDYPYIYLLNGSNNSVLASNGANSYQLARVDFTAAYTGEYVIEATSYYQNKTGSYRLSLYTSSACNQPFTASPITGTLADSDCRSMHRGNNSYFADYYIFEGSAGTQVTIDMDWTGLSFSPYVYLLSADGSIINSNCCGSSFSATLPSSGRYIIEAASESPVFAGASYTISVIGSVRPSLPVSGQVYPNGTGLWGRYVGGNVDSNHISAIAFSSNGHPGTSGFPFGFSGSNPVPFSVTWTGYIVPPQTGLYLFYMSRDDDANVFINDQQIIFSGSGSSVAETQGAFLLTANVPHRIRVEYWQSQCCVARAALYWELPGLLPRQIIPASALYYQNPGPADAFAAGQPYYLTAGSNPLIPDEDSYSGGVARGSSKTQTVWVNYLGVSQTTPIKFNAISTPPGVEVNFNPQECTPGILYDPNELLNVPRNNTCSVQMVMFAPNSLPIDISNYSITVTAARGSVPEATMVYALEIFPANGLIGKYYEGTNFNELKHTRIDPDVNFGWGIGVSPAPGVSSSYFSVRWTGKVITKGAGSYQFCSQGDDGDRLYVNGVLLVEDWISPTLGDKCGTLALAANTKYNLKLELFNNVHPSGEYLRWVPPGESKHIIPSAYLFPEEDVAPPVVVPNPTAPFTFQFDTFDVGTGFSFPILDPGQGIDVPQYIIHLSGTPAPIDLSYQIVGGNTAANLGGPGISVSFNPDPCSIPNSLGGETQCSTMRVQTSASTPTGQYAIVITGQASNPEGVSKWTYNFSVIDPSDPIIKQLEDAIAEAQRQINEFLGGTAVFGTGTFFLADHESNYEIRSLGNSSRQIDVFANSNLGITGTPKVALSYVPNAQNITATFSYPDPIPSPDTDLSCDYYPTGIVGLGERICTANAVINVPSGTLPGQYILQINGIGQFTSATAGGIPVSDPASRSSMFYVINVPDQPCPPGTVGTAGACVVPPSVFTHVLTDPNNTYAVNMSAGGTNTSGRIKVTAVPETIGPEGKRISFETIAITKVGALNTTGFTASASFCDVSTFQPACLSTITINASSFAAGQYIVAFKSFAGDGSPEGTISYTVTVTAPSGYSVTPTQTSFDFTYGSPDVRTTGFAVAGNPGAVTFLQPEIRDENGSLLTPATSGINVTVAPNVCASNLTCPAQLIISYTPISPTLAPPSNKTFYIWGDTHAVNTPAAQKWTERVRVTITVR